MCKNKVSDWKKWLLPEPEHIYDGREAIRLKKKSRFGGGRTRDRGGASRPPYHWASPPVSIWMINFNDS